MGNVQFLVKCKQCFLYQCSTLFQLLRLLKWQNVPQILLSLWKWHFISRNNCCRKIWNWVQSFIKASHIFLGVRLSHVISYLQLRMFSWEQTLLERLKLLQPGTEIIYHELIQTSQAAIIFITYFINKILVLIFY